MELNFLRRKSVFIVLLIIVFALLINLVCIKLLKEEEIYNLIDEENLSTIGKSELENEVFSFIKDIDNIALSVISINDKNVINFNDEQKLDLAVLYIIQNLNEYKNEVKDLEYVFSYIDDDTEYQSIGYIDKKVIKDIVYKIFNKQVEFEGYKFYDSKSGFVALVPYIFEKAGFDSEELVQFNELDSKTYIVTVKYIRKLDSITNEFMIDYHIVRNKDNKGDNVSSLQNMKIYNSKTY